MRLIADLELEICLAFQDREPDLDLFGAAHPACFSARRVWAGAGCHGQPAEFRLRIRNNAGKPIRAPSNRSKFAATARRAVNLLSIAIQELQCQTPESAGRIHNDQRSPGRRPMARKAGFDNLI